MDLYNIYGYGYIVYNIIYYQHDYSNFDQGKCLSDFTNLNFEYLNDNKSSVCAKFNRVLLHVDDIVNKHAPLTKFTIKDTSLQGKPWKTNRIRKMMRVRDNLLKRLRKRSDEETIHLYNNLENEWSWS